MPVRGRVHVSASARRGQQRALIGFAAVGVAGKLGAAHRVELNLGPL